MRAVKLIPIQLDKPRHLLLNMCAIYKCELALAKTYGEKRVSLPKIFKGGDLSMTELLHLLWMGLLHEDPNLTLDQVAAMASGVPSRTIDLALGEALREQAGLKEAADAGPTAATPPSGTGSDSGATDVSLSGSPMPSSGT
jgi:hypothetical protein